MKARSQSNEFSNLITTIGFHLLARIFFSCFYFELEAPQIKVNVQQFIMNS